MSKRAIWITTLLAAALAGGAGWYLWKRKADEAPRFRTARVERGDIQVSVTATGTLQALITVQVGTQVSGPIASLHADFNSEVKKGQVIARLDTTLLVAALNDARSNLARVAAQEHQAGLELKRTQALFDRSLVSQAELDQAVAARKVAAANLSSAESQVERARINLRYAIITSPIDGIVLSRAVDVGQTVAASFNTPTLFTIAGDLRQMEVKAAVDEADIGKVKEGQEATFTVDAFPEATFTGTVQQVRLEPKVDQNVVSYDVVLRVPNPDKQLMPGMTANLTIAVTSKEDVLLVPSAALRFRPPRMGKDPAGEAGGEAGGGRGRREGGAGGEGPGTREAPGSGGDREEGPGQPLRAGGGLGRPGPDGAVASSGAVAAGAGAGAAADSADSADSAGGRRNGGRSWAREGRERGRDGNRGKVYLLVDGRPVPVRVRTGLSDGSRTEIEGVEGDIAPGSVVVTGLEGANPGTGAGRPFGLQPGGPGGGRGTGGGGRRYH